MTDDIRAEKQRRLHALELQQAQFGLHTPPHITMEIEKLRAELELTSGPPLQLPELALHFTDRDAELKQLIAALTPGATYTLCGPGGMGKTSLAAKALHELYAQGELAQRFPGGVILHNFYAQPKILDAAAHIAQSLHTDPRPHPLPAALNALSRAQTLLILDGAEDADNLGELLKIRGQAAILITTRDKRRTTNRHDLPPLSEKDAADLLQKWSGSDDPAAARIAELVGGLPLALRIVGSFLDETDETPAEYLPELESTPLRSLTMEERRDQSVDYLLRRTVEKLSEAAQNALAAIGWLSPTPFDRETIAAALDTDNPREPLNELTRYSLLTPDPDTRRYTVSHRLIHTYATRRLIEHHPDPLRRLTEYFNALAREHIPQGLPGYQHLDPDLQHILTLLGHCQKQALYDPARRLVWAMDDYFFSSYGYATDWITVLEVGLAAAQATENRYDESAFLQKLGLSYANLGNVMQAIDFYEQALVIAREIGDRRGEGSDLGSLGLAYARLGQVERAIDYHEKALVISREIGDRRGEGADLGNLGNAYADLGQVKRAIDYHEKSLAIKREIGNRSGEGNSLGSLGNAYRNLGQVERAIDYHQQALVISREIGDRRGEGADLGNLGLAYADLGQVERAIDYHEKALVIAREIGDRRGEGNHLGNLGIAYKDLGQVERAIDYHERALVISREIGDRRGEGNRLGNLGNAYRNLGQVERAIDYHQQALVISREIGDRRGEGADLGNLGNAYKDLGQVEQARQFYQQALAIFEEIKSPAAEQARQLLAGLDAS